MATDSNVKEERTMAEPLMDYKTTARRLGVKLGTLYSWVCRNRIPHVRMSARCVRFDPVRIEEWIAAQECEPDGSASGDGEVWP